MPFVCDAYEVGYVRRLYDLEEVHDKARLEHEEVLQKSRTEAKMSEERIGADREGAFSLYHGLSHSIRDIVKAADERNAGHADTSTQFQLLCEEERNLKAVLSLAGPSQERLRVADLESVFEAKEPELQTLLGIASDNITLRAEASRLSASAETLGREKR